MLARRRAGVLMHAGSLPGAGRGVLGTAARSFVDWLRDAGFSVWQFLPVGPVGRDRSPYYARSNHAGDPGLIDLETLAAAGLIDPGRLAAAPRVELLADAATRLHADSAGGLRQAYGDFAARAAGWLGDWALYSALKAHAGGRPWWDWPDKLRDRDPAALAAAHAALADHIARVAAEQFFFHAQWRALRDYAAGRGLGFFGDLPIYPAPDSVEVWAHRELFELDAAGRPLAVAGVPPDYFAPQGQLWGNPLYRWEAHRRSGFAWWLGRLRAQFELFDLVRIDHFRGLEAFWAVPAGAASAAAGEWRNAPGALLLERALETFGTLAVVAEDLGVITREVEELRDAYALPGMRVAQFGFDGDPENPHLPHNWIRHALGYTGTHDNDTTAGWYADLDPAARAQVAEYLGCPPDAVVPALTRTVLASVAQLAVVPMQDLLGLGTEARMNTPGTATGNWEWRMRSDAVPAGLAARLARWNTLYGRS